MPDSLPSISIVVPNYNGAKTIEATLRSLLDQNYPNLQVIVIDGGSKDQSVDIIKKYQPHLAFWVSEKDRGQSHAINKGFAHCTGDIVNWLCSDDTLTPGALHYVGQFFANHPATDVLAGKTLNKYPDSGAEIEDGPDQSNGGIDALPARNWIRQPSCFWRRRLIARTPPVREDLFYHMDAELWAYFVSRGATWHITDKCLSVAYQDGNNKTRSANYRYYIEYDQIFRAHAKPHQKTVLPLWFRISIGPMYRRRDRSSLPFVRGSMQLGIDLIAKLQKFRRTVKNN